MTEKFKECSTCFFTEEFPGVTIGENGQCSFCNSHLFDQEKQALTKKGIEELKVIAENLKRDRRGKYDCIIGASGGLDSSYVIYIAKKLLGLNPLVINYDHGHNFDIAIENLRTICRTLGVDCKTLRSKQKNDQHYLRHMVLGLKDTEVFWGVCSFCHYILPTVVYQNALQEKISTILVSTNLYEWRLYLKASRKIRFILKQLMKLKLTGMIKAIVHIMIAQYYLLRFKCEFYLPPFTNLFKREPKTPKGIQKINLTDYVEWDIDTMVATMKRETGWQTPSNAKLPMRFDCKIEEGLINQTYRKACGFTVHGIICNNLIYGKWKTKQELKETFDLYHQEIEQCTKDVFNGLGIG